MPRDRRIYNALALVVVAGITAATAALIAALALISRKDPGE